VRYAKEFFTYARERYQVKLNKEAGRPKPWTADPILQQYRFCNVFREDDTTTRWIRERITHESYGNQLVGAMVIARWFNRVETLELLLPYHRPVPAFRADLFAHWSRSYKGWRDDMVTRLQDVKPLVTGAYMVKTPAGAPKLEGVLWALGELLPDAVDIYNVLSQPGFSLEHATNLLATYPYLGPFMAYEIITDLRHTPVLSTAPDIMTWANPGPGAARGLARVLGLSLDHYNRHSRADVVAMNGGMRHLLALSRVESHWPAQWPKWEMRDVEHTLCEFDKYERALLGQGTPKQRYNGV
jgi:hypothetical protein